MKSVAMTMMAGVLMAVSGCKKNEGLTGSGKMTVIKNCTGVYLGQNGKNYKVCNVEMLARYEHGAEVTAGFGKLASCKPEDDKIICMMAFPYETYVQVAYIK